DASGELTERGSERERIKSQAERWLQLYGSTTGNARDAQHVRFMLIRILAKELEEVPENRRQTAESQQKLDRALALIESMDNGRTDHQESLERLKYTVLRLSGRAKGSLETIKTFDEALLRSSMEFYNQQILEAKLREVGDAPARVDVESQFREQVHATLSALRRTQELMEYTSVSERNRIRILNMMQACYRRVNDGPRAALICEHLAYSARQPEIAQSAAGEALRLYQFLSSDGGKLDTTAHARLFSVAKFLEERYPDSPQADEARSILGRDLIARKQYDPAIQLLTKVKSKPGVSLYLAGLASWSKYLESNKNNPPKKTAEVSQALELLQRSISSLQAQTQKDDIEQRTEVQAALLLLGIHDSLGETNAVIASAEPLLKRIEDKQMPTGITVGTELQVLETVMNAYIQNKDFVNGPKRILAILDKRKNDNSLGNSTRFLQSTALRIRSQLDEFQKQGASTKTAYEAVLNSFRLFLEQIDKSAELQSSQRVWLANSYMVIGDFAKAVRVLENIKEPQSKQSSDAKDGDENEQQWFRQASALLIQALREMAMLEEDANDRDKQLSVVERELQKIMQEPWAKRNPNLLRDEIYLLQLRGKYSGRTGAITRWDQFRNVLAPLHTKNDAMKELYWEAWHNLAYCVFKEAQILRNPEAKQKAVNRAAALIAEAKRENYGTLTQAARFRELLSNPQHSELQAAFERMQTPAKK
ncbi:MAG TPA: hypothetical protein PKD72_06050, partial [Gemmatales bacterium]|nr:hypothetical protein [Gemmatales bacterium]